MRLLIERVPAVILADLVEQVAYRMHAPRWASLPLSGEGAAKHG